MAAVTVTVDAGTPAAEVIDLTRSDSEDELPTPTLPSRPLSETPGVRPFEEPVVAHGLLLDRGFGSLNRLGWSRGASFSSSKLLNGGATELRRHVTSRPSNRGGSQLHRRFTPKPSNVGTSQLRQGMAYKTRRIGRRSVMRPKVRQTHDYPTNIVKRLRATLGFGNNDDRNEQSNEAGHKRRSSEMNVGTEKLKADTLSVGPQFDAVQSFHIPQRDQHGNVVSKDAMNESLKIALRQQVFPHVNRRLANYRLSIDCGTRRQLGKKAAWEICGAEFMNNLMENDGCLSVAYENKIAALAYSLIDQYAAKFVKRKGKEQDKTIDRELESVLKALQKKDRQEQSQTNTRSTVSSVEAARASRSARLSALMKGRWARGEMESAATKSAATRLLKKVAQNSMQQTQGPSRQRKGQAFTERSLPLKTSGTQISSTNHDMHRPARQLIVKLRIKEPLRKQPSPHSFSRASDPRRPISELGERPQFLRNSAGPSDAKVTKASAVVRHLASSEISRQGLGTQRRRKPMVGLEFVTIRSRIENLQLAGLDECVSRPYLTWQQLKDIEKGLALIHSKKGTHANFEEAKLLTLQGSTLHVDFSQDEIEHIVPVVESVMGKCLSSVPVSSKVRIENIMLKRETMVPKVVAALVGARQVQGSRLSKIRTSTALTAFLQDAAAGTLSNQPRIRRIELRSTPSRKSVTPADTIKSTLLQREVWGRRRNPAASNSFKARLLCALEDDFVHQAEWTDCSGDIATVEWIDCERFFCGATTHSDEHNMQYNKPGNLLVGATVEKTLKSVPGHRIVRPLVATGENSLEAMRGTQDPWMYCSVTSTAYSHDNRKCFTGSYDQSVKVWDIAGDGSVMTLCGIWNHSGNVNFVAASPSHGLVATAADVREDAVRVYRFDPSNITASAFSIYDASVQRHNSSDNWAYFPSAMRWGISPSVSHLLLVGYSPRSFNCHDEDIPDDKINSGELCLWDSTDGSRIPITSARTQNVFEVVWHPTQPIFIAATSPAGLFEDWVRTQLRVFQQTACGSFSHVKTLDCPALDINEITIMPNSIVNSYVTASCTDGSTYVWDSALSDKPLHVLRHGDSIDEHMYDEAGEDSDIGVKFAAWGNNFDRFYTGSSDGMVKAWNIRAPPGQEFIRNVVKLSGGISAGKFSPDFSNLIIGDSTGKVHLFSLEKFESSEESYTALRNPIIPHAPLPAPLIDDDDMEIPLEQTATEIAQEFVKKGQIFIHEDEWVGAVQGPNYATTGLLYNAENHKNELPGWSRRELNEQQQQRYRTDNIQVPQLGDIHSSNGLLHQKNLALDLDLSALLPNLNAYLETGIDLGFESETSFSYELGHGLTTEELEGISLTENEPLSDKEIQTFKVLKQQIFYRLCVQKSLNNL